MDFAISKGAPVPDNAEAAESQILVRFKPNRAEAAIRDVEKTHHIKVADQKKFRTIGWHRLTLKSDKKLKEIVEAYRRHPDVVYAEPNYVIQASVTPNDGRFGELWGLHNTGQNGGTPDADIDAPEAWEIAAESDVIVAVIDSGVAYGHPDLAANMWRNGAEIPANGIDDDGNGYVDDVRGWDFVNGDGDPMDDNMYSHGTHVAGTIGAVGSNSVGVAGVCWGVRIMPLKILNVLGYGYISDAIDAIEYAALMRAKVLNASWGWSGSSSVALGEAIEAADAAGILFVTAAGNNGTDNDTSTFYPACYEISNIIAVAATTRSDDLADFSNYGAASVDLSAPGMSILSTVLGGYAVKDGTSMAAPHVAGACALVWSAAGPGYSHRDVRDMILGRVDPLAALAGKCVTGGRLNLRTAVQAAATNRVLFLKSPNGWESVESGSTVAITWIACGSPWAPGDTVRLNYSADAGTNWSGVAGAENLTYNAKSFNWNTTGCAPGTQYLVRVSFTGNPEIADSSEHAFAIVGALDHFDFRMASPQVSGRAVQNLCMATAKDSNGWTIATFGSFGTAGRFPVTITAPNVQIGGLSAGGNALATSDFVKGVADLTAEGMLTTVTSAPAVVQFTVASANGKTGISENVEIVERPDYFTEHFDTLPFDLAGRSLIFIPDGSSDYYACYYLPIETLPTDPAGGTVLQLPGGLTYAEAVLANAAVSLYGVAYTNFFISSSGFISFNSGDVYAGSSIAHHFKLPRISAIFDSFGPEGGTVSWKQMSDRAAVTYDNVTVASTFQAELFFDGRIVLSYEQVTSDGLVGLSRGTGTPADFVESDMSSYPLLPARLLRMKDPNGGEQIATGAVVAIAWAAYGTNWQSADTVALDYSADHGTNWAPISGADALAYDLAAFDWDTAGLATGRQYRVRARFGAPGGISDGSDSNFAIVADRFLAILAPNGGEIFHVGATAVVAWACSGVEWAPGDTVRLEYSDDGGAAWSQIPGAESLAYDLGAFSWDTSGFGRGGDRLIRVSWANDPVVNDVSDGPFFLPATYYVNDGFTTNDEWCTAAGSDTNSGASPGSPKATVNAILSEHDLGAGDTVRIDTGIYYLPSGVAVLEGQGGADGAPVVFESSPYGVTMVGLGGHVWQVNADYVTIRTADGTNHPTVEKRPMRITGGKDGIHAEFAGHCTIAGLDISGNARDGINAEYCDDGTYRNNTIASNDYGIYLELCPRSTARSNTVYDNGSSGMATWYCPVSAVQSNSIRHCDGNSGVETWYSANSRVEHNTISDCTGYGITMWWSPQSLLRNNLLVSNDIANIEIWNSEGSVVENNTLAGRAYYQIYSGYNSFIFRNNIVWAEGEDNQACDFNVDMPVSDYNLFFLTNGAFMGWAPDGYIKNLARWRELTAQDRHSLCRDPLFVNPGAGDYHLQSTAGSYHSGDWTPDPGDSPGIDAGWGDAGDEPQTNATPWQAANLGGRNLGAYGGTTKASKTPASRIVLLYEPAGGECYPNQAVPADIRWTWAGTAWQSNDTLRFDYATNSGAWWAAIAGAEDRDLTNGTYSWGIAGVPPSLLMRVRTICNEDAAVTDQSMLDFRIGGPFAWYVNDASTNDDEWCLTGGLDANTGLSPAAPKATVQSVLAAYDLEPGDEVRIDTGSYELTNGIVVNRWQSGASNAPVLFKASPYGVTMAWETGGNTGTLWTVQGADYVAIRTAASGKYPARPQRWMRLARGSCGISVAWDVTFCAFERLEIVSNAADGVHCSGGPVILRNNIVRQNGDDGVEFEDVALLENNTIAGNTDDQVVSGGNATLTLRNNIVCADGTNDYALYWTAPLQNLVSDYNLFFVTNGAYVGYAGGARSSLAQWREATAQDGHGLGQSPLFVDTTGGDFHLQSIAGSYHASVWALDASDSPGIDTGDPHASCSNEPAWNGGFINLGAYGNTEQASKSSDSDNDGLSDTFETVRFGTSVGDPDTDNDTMSDWGEYVAGTDPLVSTSLLVFTSMTVGTEESAFVIRWQSVSNRIYAIQRATNSISDGFTPFISNITASPPVNVYTDTVDGISRAFYQIETRRP